MNVIEKAELEERAVKILLENGTTLSFEDCWLRDHCSCLSCNKYEETFQRAQHILDIPDTLIREVTFTNSEIHIDWKDMHTSIYHVDFLAKYDFAKWKKRQCLKPLLWRGAEISEKVTKIHVDKFLNTKEGAEIVFQSLLDYGFALIFGVEPTMKATEQVGRALGGIQHLHFGGMWQFAPIRDHKDTANTNTYLAVHNDNTYLYNPAGLQILHCLEHVNGTGGETTLVDGFYGAMWLKENYPEDFEFLSTFPIETSYKEEGHAYKLSTPVIQIDPNTKELKRIRFNVYDRSPMAFSSSQECRSYYRSLKHLASFYEDPQNQWRYKLTPGVIMIMDNFRLLHGRTGFTGYRLMSGCYISQDNWLEKARALRLI